MQIQAPEPTQKPTAPGQDDPAAEPGSDLPPEAYNLVPKPTLIAKIKAKTKNNFARSDQVPAGDHQTVTAEAGKDLAKVFTAGKAGLCGYIDYTI